MAETPNPGSREAIDLGCSCPRMDNHNGRGIPTENGTAFWKTEGCPLHWPPPAAPPNDEGGGTLNPKEKP